MTTEIFRWNAALQSTYATFGDWVAAQSDPISLAVGKDIDLGGATVNVPNNIDFVEFYNGAQIKNGTITINRMSAMPLYQIFDSTITIIFGTGAIKEQYIEWYGGKPSVDKSYESANDAAIAKAISIPAPIKLLPATYWFSMPIVFNGVNSNYSLRGTDGYTVIRSTVSNNYIINIMACQRIDIGDFELNGSNVYGGIYAEEIARSVISNIIGRYGLSGKMIHLNGCEDFIVRHITFTTNGYQPYYVAPNKIMVDYGIYCESSANYAFNANSITDIIIEGWNKSAIYLNGLGNARSWFKNILVQGGIDTYGGGLGLELRAANNLVFEDSYFEATPADFTRTVLYNDKFALMVSPHAATNSTDFGGGFPNIQTMVWENNTLLSRQTSLSNVDSNAGSFFYNTVNNILYIHASDSSDISINGKLYILAQNSELLNASFTNEIGTTDKISLNTNQSNSYLHVYENNILLTRKNTKVLCEAATGSYFFDTAAQLLYVNATAGNASSNSKTYEASECGLSIKMEDCIGVVIKNSGATFRISGDSKDNYLSNPFIDGSVIDTTCYHTTIDGGIYGAFGGGSFMNFNETTKLLNSQTGTYFGNGTYDNYLGIRQNLSNMILNKNVGFDRWIDSANPDGYSALNGAVLLRTSSPKFAGTYCCKVTTSGVTSKQGLQVNLSSDARLLPNDWITVTAEIYIPTANASEFLGIFFYNNSTYQESSYETTYRYPKNTWITISHSFFCSNSTDLKVIISPSKTPAGGEYIYVGRMEIRRGLVGGFMGDTPANQQSEYYVNNKRIFTGSVQPVSGYHFKGDIMIYDSPSAGGYLFSYCSTAGNPGIWEDVASNQPSHWKVADTNASNPNVELELRQLGDGTAGLEIRRSGTSPTTWQINAVTGTTDISFLCVNAGYYGNKLILRQGGSINMPSLPTSSAGLVSGDLWNNSGTIKIV